MPWHRMTAFTSRMIKRWPVPQYAFRHGGPGKHCSGVVKDGVLNDPAICRWEAHLWVKDLGRQVCTARCPLPEAADKQLKSFQSRDSLQDILRLATCFGCMLLTAGQIALLCMNARALLLRQPGCMNKDAQVP